MKSVLISIQPKWCELIASGKKTVEVRKTKPKLPTPFKCYIYESSGNHRVGNENFNVYLKGKGRKKVIGEFVCDEVDRIAHCGTCNNDIRLKIVDNNLYCKELDYVYLNKCQLSYFDINEYSNGGDVYGWHITNLIIYDEPKELSEFQKYGALSYDDWLYGLYNGSSESSYEKYLIPFKVSRPPQSWCYVEAMT